MEGLLPPLPDSCWHCCCWPSHITDRDKEEGGFGLREFGSSAIVVDGVSWYLGRPFAVAQWSRPLLDSPFSAHSVNGLSWAGRSLTDRLGKWKDPGSLEEDDRFVRSATFELSGDTLVEVEEAGDTLREAPTSNCFWRICFAPSYDSGLESVAPCPIFSNSSVSVSDSNPPLKSYKYTVTLWCFKNSLLLMKWWLPVEQHRSSRSFLFLGSYIDAHGGAIFFFVAIGACLGETLRQEELRDAVQIWQRDSERQFG